MKSISAHHVARFLHCTSLAFKFCLLEGSTHNALLQAYRAMYVRRASSFSLVGYKCSSQYVGAGVRVDPASPT